MNSKLIKTLRVPNLLMIAFTMYAIRYGVVYSFLKYNHFELQTSNFLFLLLVLATVLVAAGGYVINDFQDRKIDLENSGKQPNEEGCCKKMMTLYNYLTVIGVAIGGVVSYFIGQFMFTGIFLLVAGLLWFYSTTYKFMPFVGNIIVAFLTAIVPLMVVIYEIPLLTSKYHDFLIKNNIDFMPLFYFVATFSLFAFLVNLIREIVKDLEDITGDAIFKKNTIPVYFGEVVAKITISLLSLFTAGLLLYVQFNYKLGVVSMWYILVALTFPLVLVAIKIFVDNTPEAFHSTSTLLKITMLLGILYSIVFYFNLFEIETNLSSTEIV